jgi:hypothetical protein
MKFQAFILFIAASIYLTETVKLPFALLQSSKTSPCCARMKMAKMMLCHQQKNPENSGTSKCNDMNCPNCPLGYISTFQPGIDFKITLNYLKTKYPLIESDCVSEYIFKAWKPPDII